MRYNYLKTKTFVTPFGAVEKVLAIGNHISTIAFTINGSRLYDLVNTKTIAKISAYLIRYWWLPYNLKSLCLIVVAYGVSLANESCMIHIWTVGSVLTWQPSVSKSRFGVRWLHRFNSIVVL